MNFSLGENVLLCLDRCVILIVFIVSLLLWLADCDVWYTVCLSIALRTPVVVRVMVTAKIGS